MNKLWMQIRREFWECRASFVRAPILMALLLMTLLLLGIVPLQEKIGAVMEHAQSHLSEGAEPARKVLPSVLGDQPLGTDPEHLVHGLATIYSVFTLVLLFVLVFYFADALYLDRRDRSVLFWKSLPVSESRLVAGKLMAGTLGAPLIYAAAAMITSGFFLLVFVFYAGVVWDMAMPGVGTVLTSYISSSVGMVMGWLLLAIWWLPIFCWLLFSSAVVSKTPFLLGLGAPIGFIVLEAWTLGSTRVAGLVTGQVVAGVHAFQSLVHGPHKFVEQFSVAIGAPALWIGLGVSAVLLYGCVWLRNNRWEL